MTPIQQFAVLLLLMALGAMLLTTWQARCHRLLKQLRRATEGDYIVLDPGKWGVIGRRVCYLCFSHLEGKKIVARHAFDPGNTDYRKYRIFWLPACRAHVIKADSPHGRKLATKMLGASPRHNVQPPDPQAA